MTTVEVANRLVEFCEKGDFEGVEEIREIADLGVQAGKEKAGIRHPEYGLERLAETAMDGERFHAPASNPRN